MFGCGVWPYAWFCEVLNICYPLPATSKTRMFVGGFSLYIKPTNRHPFDVLQVGFAFLNICYTLGITEKAGFVFFFVYLIHVAWFELCQT